METKKETAAALEGVTAAEQSALRGVPSYSNDTVQQDEQGAEQSEGKTVSAEHKVRRKRNLGLRIVLWLLLKSIVPILCILALAGGLYVGFVVVGKQSLDDALKWETWKHMYDLIFADT
ncbi:DNA-directed RNA polymerase subunit beta [Paenibacillus sp. GCM10027626]|uniref:DNA-directed RNA polymerase subunit beta n=1 Tax=Paenibacillus sp. GCM10027626 TaxID=3273411 RepID=UPI003645D453